MESFICLQLQNGRIDTKLIYIHQNHTYLVLYYVYTAS